MKTHQFLFLSCAVLSVSGFLLDTEQEWQLFKTQFNKSYDIAEEQVRRKIWTINLRKINTHNVAERNGQKSYRLGMNHFGDMTSEEVQQRFTGLIPPTNHTRSQLFSRNKLLVLPKRVDWRKRGYVTHVKHQGTCGSCYAFSATGALEGQHYKKTGKLVPLSEQNIVDCSKREGNKGCHGGFMDNAFKYVIRNDGLDTEKGYPYNGWESECKFRKKYVGTKASNYIDLPEDDEEALQEAVATVGPISAGICVTHDFHLYSSGVYDNDDCNHKLNHGILVVGYGTYRGKDYWMVKNSWGKWWGLQGYIRMARNKDNQCGIATLASYPVV